MEERFESATAAFNHSMQRARQMVALFDALSALRPNDSANDDALRAAYFQCVSSFDYFAHELAAVETRYRLEQGVKTRNIAFPMEILTIANATDRIDAAVSQIRLSNSFKAFVDPAKLAEMLSCFCDQPWAKITVALNNSHPADPAATSESLKLQLKSIWKRRNQIAHEADVNPSLAGISLWPISKDDTISTIAFVTLIGSVLTDVIKEELSRVEIALND